VAEIARARAIGPRVCHDLHLLMVTPVYGVLEQYYGDVGGVAWPTRADQSLSELQGHRQPSASVRLRRYRRSGIRFAVVTDDSVTREQPDLAEALQSYPVVARGSGWAVYDFEPGTPARCAALSTPH
ncbi:MAG: hypothetical protein QOJ00_2413, partial [Actinomycetota bacterium]